jgi:hypothetical protein
MRSFRCGPAAIAIVALVLVLVAAVHVTRVWRPSVPDCTRGEPGTCLQYPDGTVR